MKKLILFILLTNSIISYSQVEEEFSRSQKKNLIGLDLSLGVSVHTKRKPRLSFGGALNYSRISKKRNHYLEFGVRYTQLNFSSYKSEGSSLTYEMEYENILLIEFPLGFKKSFTINEKTDFMIGFNVFYSTYIKWLVRYDVILRKDDTVISSQPGTIEPYTTDKIGLEVNFGISRHITPKLLLNASINVNVRSELDLFANEVYAFPNLTVGIKRFF